MAIFQYQGRDHRGAQVEGQLNATSVDAVIDTLTKEGIVPTDIYLLKKSFLPFFTILKKRFFFQKVPTEELIIFCRQMYSLIKSGIPLIKSLTLLAETTQSSLFSEALKKVIEEIAAGQNLSTALGKHSHIFSPFFISLVQAGENTGQLETIFLQISEYLELIDRTRKQIKTAIRYPLLVVTALLSALLIVNLFVLPNFAEVFARFEVALPLPTRILFSVSHALTQNWFYLMTLLVVLIITGHYYLKTPHGQYLWDRLQLKIPVIGTIIQRILLGRFARSFSMVFQTGVPIEKGIELVSAIVDNEYMRRRILMMQNAIEQGKTLTVAAFETKLFSPLILQMLRTGEESGTLEVLLREAADFYEREVEYDLRRLSDLIEPILLVILGIMVLTLALGIFLPMWNMIQFVRG